MALAMPLAACGDNGDDGPVRVSVIGDSKQIEAPLTHIMSSAGQVSFAATARGIVTYDANGDVVPGLAQRWIVVDDGKSYIFRLRRSHWVNGDQIDAKEVKAAFEKRLRAERQVDPYGSMASVSEVLAMTGDVLEIRLKAPRPNFLVALAQPELGIARKSGGSGLYRKTARAAAGDALLLTPVDVLNEDDEPVDERKLRVMRAERAAKSVVRFKNGLTDLVLGGSLADLPYVTLAEIDGRSVRFDPVQGLFGLAFSKRNRMFDDLQVREALAMAIEREAIVTYFDISRWKIAEQIMPQQFDLPHGPTAPEWTRLSMDERRSRAIGTIARWRAQHDGEPVTLTIGLPEGPGMELLFIALKDQFRQVGVGLERAEKDGDLVLIDEVAPYDSASWYLGRLSCARGLRCYQEAEDLLEASASASSLAERVELLGQAEPMMTAYGAFIPLATPVRWSLVRSRLDGFMPSPRAHHDLSSLRK